MAGERLQHRGQRQKLCELISDQLYSKYMLNDLFSLLEQKKRNYEKNVNALKHGPKLTLASRLLETTRHSGWY